MASAGGSAPPIPQMGGMGPMAGGMGGGRFGAPTAQAPPAGGAEPSSTAKPPKGRVDPFKPWWEARPAVLSVVSPVRLAPASVSGPPPSQPVEIQEPPMGRVAGVLTGNGAYALLERPDGITVVKPGDVVAGYRVEAINATSIVLKRKVGNRTYTQIVPLTDISTSTSAAPGGGAGLMAPGGLPTMGGGPAGFRGRRGGGVGAEDEDM